MLSLVETYLSYPPGKKGKKKTDIAILYLSDIFGLPLVNNKLLADSLANAGYFVVEPDLFDGDASMLFTSTTIPEILTISQSHYHHLAVQPSI